MRKLLIMNVVWVTVFPLKPTGRSFKTNDALVLSQRSLGLKPTEAHFSESLKVKNLYHHEETYLYGNPRIVYPRFLQQ